MTSWKYFPNGDAPIMRRLNWYGPSSGVWNAVIGRDSLANDIWSYLWERCTSVKIVEPSILCKISSTVGIEVAVDCFV